LSSHKSRPLANTFATANAPIEKRRRRERNVGNSSSGCFRNTFLAVMFNMRLCGFCAVMHCMLKVPVSGMRMMGSLLMVAGFVVSGSLLVVKSCFLVVFRCLVVVFGRLL
jgi:hypothetical protein